MSIFKKGNDKTKVSASKMTMDINIPPQKSIPQMPEVKPPKKTKEEQT